MARGCTVCSNPELRQINEALKIVAYAVVARKFRLDRMTVKRHMGHMLPFKDGTTPVITPSEQVSDHGEQVSDQLSEQTGDWVARFDRMEMSLASMHGRFDALDAGIMEVWKRLEIVLESVPDEPAPTRIDPPVLDTKGLTPVEAMRVLTRDIQRVFRQTPRQEQGPVVRVLQDGLHSLASDE